MTIEAGSICPFVGRREIEPVWGIWLGEFAHFSQLAPGSISRRPTKFLGVLKVNYLGSTFTQVYDSTTGILIGLSNSTTGTANVAALSYNEHTLISDIIFKDTTGNPRNILHEIWVLPTAQGIPLLGRADFHCSVHFSREVKQESNDVLGTAKYNHKHSK